MFTAGGPQEYFNYNSPVTFGHNCARGASGVAAYAFYPPFIPEGFTSPGPSTIYFDKHSNPLRRPEQRLKPDLAAMEPTVRGSGPAGPGRPPVALRIGGTE